MSTFETFDDEVVDIHGTAHKAKIGHCRCASLPKLPGLRFASESTMFYVFQVEGQEHWHLQCVNCGTSYCPQGLCQDA